MGGDRAAREDQTGVTMQTTTVEEMLKHVARFDQLRGSDVDADGR